MKKTNLVITVAAALLSTAVVVHTAHTQVRRTTKAVRKPAPSTTSSSGSSGANANAALQAEVTALRAEVDALKAVLQINGNNVKIRAAQSLTLESGTNTLVKAAQNATVESGANLELKSNAQAELRATMVKVKGNSMVDVDGAIIKLN